MTPENVVLTGDCLEVMPQLDAESIDAVVTDPPYGLEFMGKAWDKLGGAGFHAPKDEGRTFTNASGHMYDNLKYLPRYGTAQRAQSWHEAWAREAYRVAKPSAYLLAFGGTRTVHRLATAIEDAGWIIRDLLVWAYASGFPKSKSSLKPAWEPIVMARKPGPLRELAIDACRIPFESSEDAAAAPLGESMADALWRGAVVQSVSIGKESRKGRPRDGVTSLQPQPQPQPHEDGRWPANLLLTDPIFDGGWDGVVGGGETGPAGVAVRRNGGGGDFFGGINPQYRPDEPWEDMGYGDSGTYSRFFLIPKANRSDREPVLGGLPTRELRTMGDGAGEWTKHGPGAITRQNHHPTVKPVDLMRHLVRLVTPPDGTVLDPFLGSGTTAIAAELEGFRWIGVEKEPEYVAIAEARLNGVQRGLGLPA